MPTTLFETFLHHPWHYDFHAHPAPRDAMLECVIVEPREHKYLPSVLKNISATLPNAALSVFLSEENRKFVEDIVYAKGMNNVRLVSIAESNITVPQYNKLMTSPQFWDSMQCEKVLLFQVDTGLRKNRVLRFMEYDYIGAPWGWTVAEDDKVKVGNGGLSLRTPRWMKYIASTFTTNDAFTEKDSGGEPEDVFFARHIVHCDQANVPSRDIAAEFSIEHTKHPDPMGFHQAYKFHSKECVSVWMTRGIEYTPCKVTIKDAWIEADNGQRYETDLLVPWLKLGISSSGLCVPKDSKLPLTEDVFPGKRKKMKVHFLKEGYEYLATVALFQGRTSDTLHVHAA
jgi:hypothetical protein